MKQSLKIALITIIIASAFWSCKKERGMTVIITAKKMSDTTEVVTGAKVNLSRDDVNISGFTDNNGQFRHTFDLQMQLDVVVTKGSLKGLGVVNMGNLGEEVNKTIYMF